MERKRGLYMYTSIINSFLESIRALRYYVESVEFANTTQIDNLEMEKNDALLVAALMSVAKTLKLNNCNIDEFDFFKDYPGELSQESKDNLHDIIKKLGDMFVVSQDGQTGEFRGVPKKIRSEYKKNSAVQKQKDILYSGTLMLLVTYFENTVAKIFRIDFQRHPGRMSLENKTVAYSILEMSENIQEVRDHLIDIEVNNLMYKSASEWITYLKKNLKLNLDYVTEKLPELKEIIARRNIIVHNDGIVNNVYLSQVKDEDLKKGDKLTVSRSYIDSAIDLIETIGTAIIIEIWLKECTKNTDEFEKIAAVIFDEYLLTERWSAAIIFYEICLSSNKLVQSDVLLCKINRWQCYKWLDKYEQIESEIDQLDSSACKTKYELGILALQDKFEEFFTVYEGQSEIGEDEIEEWPLFKNVRKSEAYRTWKERKKTLEIEETSYEKSTIN